MFFGGEKIAHSGTFSAISNRRTEPAQPLAFTHIYLRNGHSWTSNLRNSPSCVTQDKKRYEYYNARQDG